MERNEPPRWMQDKHFNEVLFCEDFLSAHPMVCVDGSFFTVEGRVADEEGKKFGLTKDFFVEPQAQLAYYWIKGKDFSMSNGMKVEQDDFNSWVGRLSLVAGKDFKDAEGNTKGQVFVKGGVKQQFAGKQKLYANSIQFKDELKGTSGYYGLGYEANPNKKVSLYGSLERENGKHYTKEIEVLLGLRYKF